MFLLTPSKTYNIDDNFFRVEPEFIDTRLTSRFVVNHIDVNVIANNISHILIYQNFVRTNAKWAIICDGLAQEFIWPNTIHVAPDNKFSYIMSKEQIFEVLSILPLYNSIDSVLVEKFAFNKKIMPRMNLCTKNDDVWSQLFTK